MKLESILKMTQEELKTAVSRELRNSGYAIVAQTGFVYAPGSVPVLLVAHLDTVHRQPPGQILYSEDRTLLMSPEGIGGDDRAGVFAILEIIKNARCHVLFCEDEETGGRGAREFARRKLKPKVNYIVELDRSGGNDAVFYDCDNPAFTEFVLGFGFELAQGSFSDISILAPPLKLAAVNISAGYYNEHTRYEVINLAETRDVIARVARMASSPSERFEYKEKAWIPSFFDLRYPDHGQAPGGSRAQRAPKAGCTKRLMPLSDAAHLQMGGNLIEPEPGAYMMDGAGKVYEYLPELDAAVLTEDAEAFSVSGLPLRFSSDKAQKTRVLPFETAWELLEMRQ